MTFLVAIGIVFLTLLNVGVVVWVVKSRLKERQRVRAVIAETAAQTSEQQLIAEEQRDFNRRLETKLRELPIGERVKYRLTDGSETWVVIQSERLKHDNGLWGWEGRFEDDGEIGFVDERRVVASGLLVN